ncbi:hypothetical protein BD560DRAFT_312612, partial [Blakeslea trispora]
GTQSSIHNPNHESFQVATWAQRLRLFQRSPFEVDTTHSNTVFVESKDRFSIAIDLAPLTGLNFQNKSLNCILRDKFPSGIGLRERRVGRQRFVEINFPSAEERDQALLNPFVIQDQPLQVSRTLDSNANVVRIGIAEIPHEQEAILKPELIDLLSQYGDILEIGLRYIEDGHWFNGRGFVTLNRDKTKQFLPLSSQIPSWEKDHSLRLSWKNMQPVCAYCHADDHLKANCPKLNLRRKAYFICGSYEHLRAKCPQASWNTNKKR